MRKLLLIVLILSTPTLCLAEDWDTKDKALLGVLIASKAIDCLQTRYIFSEPKWHEKNPMINHGVEKHGKEYIPIYFLTTTLVSALIADWLPSNLRKVWLGIWIAGSLKCVHHNYSVGIKLYF